MVKASIGFSRPMGQRKVKRILKNVSGLARCCPALAKSGSFGVSIVLHMDDCSQLWRRIWREKQRLFHFWQSALMADRHLRLA